VVGPHTRKLLGLKLIYICKLTGRSHEHFSWHYPFKEFMTKPQYF
jgi:hypothetical protein